MSNLIICDVETILLSYRYGDDELWQWSGGTTLQRNAVLVKITTNEGIVGIGEIGESAYLPRSVQLIVEEQFKGLLIGEDPLDIERLWEKMYVRSSHWGRKGVVIPIISGLEIALWDIAGKYLDQPVYELLGGCYRDKIRVYASAGMDSSLSELQAEVRSYVEQGYTAIKIRIGHHDLKADLEKVRAVKEVTGDDVALMVDAGQCYVDFAWDYNTALRVARELDKLGVYWLEEPFHPDNLDDYARLNQKVDVAVTGGENEFTKYGFKDLILNRCVDILQPDVTHTGGLLECKKIAAMAQAFHMRIAPHIFGAGIGLMANMHFIISTPNAFIMEYDETVNPLRTELLKEPLVVENGYLLIPSRTPGLGVELHRDTVERFPFIDDEAVEKHEYKPR